METTALTPAATAPKLPRRLLRIGSLVLTLLVVGAWCIVLRPSFLGGPATYVIVSGSSMRPSLESGDLVVAFDQGSYAIGDVVVYDVPGAEPGEGTHIVHRVVGGTGTTGYLVQGDSRESVDHWRPTANEVVGKMRFDIPYAGSALIAFRQPFGLAVLAGLVGFLIVLWVSAGRELEPRTTSSTLRKRVRRRSGAASRRRGCSGCPGPAWHRVLPPLG